MKRLLILLLLAPAVHLTSQKLDLTKCKDVIIQKLDFQNPIQPGKFENELLFSTHHDLESTITNICSKCNIINRIDIGTLQQIYENEKKIDDPNFQKTPPQYTIIAKIDPKDNKYQNTVLHLKVQKIRTPDSTVKIIDVKFKNGEILDDKQRYQRIEEAIKYQYLGFQRYSQKRPITIGLCSAAACGTGLALSLHTRQKWNKNLSSNWNLDIDQKYNDTRTTYNIYRGITLTATAGIIYSTYKYLKNARKKRMQTNACSEERTTSSFKKNLSMSINYNVVALHYKF